jgi:hypothetical protein
MTPLSTYHLQLINERLSDGLPWNLGCVAQNPAVPIKVARELLEQRECTNVFWLLSYRYDLTDSYVEEHINEKWNWFAVLRCANLSPEFLQKHYQKWPAGVMWNPRAPMEFLKAIPDFSGKYYHWSYNPLLTREVLKEFPDKDWRMDKVCANCNLTAADVKSMGLRGYTGYCRQESRISRQMNFDQFSILYAHNVKLTVTEIIEDYMPTRVLHDYAIWECFSQNPYLFGFKEELAAFARRHMAAFRIQQRWLRCYYDPDHPVCRRRLLREFREFSDLQA